MKHQVSCNPYPPRARPSAASCSTVVVRCSLFKPLRCSLFKPLLAVLSAHYPYRPRLPGEGTVLSSLSPPSRLSIITVLCSVTRQSLPRVRIPNDSQPVDWLVVDPLDRGARATTSDVRTRGRPRRPGYGCHRVRSVRPDFALPRWRPTIYFSSQTSVLCLSTAESYC